MLLTINGKVNRIDQTGVVPIGESFEVLGQNGVADSLAKAQKARLETASAPKFIEARNDCPNFNDPLWNWHVVSTGIYNIGENTHFYHGETGQPLTDPQRIRKQ